MQDSDIQFDSQRKPNISHHTHDHNVRIRPVQPKLPAHVPIGNQATPPPPRPSRPTLPHRPTSQTESGLGRGRRTSAGESGTASPQHHRQSLSTDLTGSQPDTGNAAADKNGIKKDKRYVDIVKQDAVQENRTEGNNSSLTSATSHGSQLSPVPAISTSGKTGKREGEEKRTETGKRSEEPPQKGIVRHMTSVWHSRSHRVGAPPMLSQHGNSAMPSPQSSQPPQPNSSHSRYVGKRRRNNGNNAHRRPHTNPTYNDYSNSGSSINANRRRWLPWHRGEERCTDTLC